MTGDNLDLHAALAALIEVLSGDDEAWTLVPVPIRAALPPLRLPGAVGQSLA